MNVFVEMPKDTPFKAGDIYMERGYRITAIEGGLTKHEDTQGIFFRPVSDGQTVALATATALTELADKLKETAQVVEEHVEKL